MQKFMNKIANVFMKPLLRSPLHFLVSKNVMLITFTGRKSGKTYTTPVQYHQKGDIVIFLTPNSRTWWKNLKNAAPVQLIIQGKEYNAATESIITRQEQLLTNIQEMYPNLTQSQTENWSQHFLIIQLKLNQS